MTYDDYLKQIITFNSDKDIITLTSHPSLR